MLLTAAKWAFCHSILVGWLGGWEGEILFRHWLHNVAIPEILHSHLPLVCACCEQDSEYCYVAFCSEKIWVVCSKQCVACVCFILQLDYFCCYTLRLDLIMHLKQVGWFDMIFPNSRIDEYELQRWCLCGTNGNESWFWIAWVEFKSMWLLYCVLFPCKE